MNPDLLPGRTRIVLTWEADPRDLDAHFTGPDGAGGRFHVSAAGRVALRGDTVTVAMDTDAAGGWGPETITMNRQYPGTYCFSVHLRGGTGSLAASGALVRVFRYTGQVATYPVPATHDGVWTVFRIDGVIITPVYTTGSAVPGDCAESGFRFGL